MVQLKPITEQDDKLFFDLITNNTERLLDYFPVTVKQVLSVSTARTTIFEYIQQWKDDKWRIYKITYEHELAGILYIKHIDRKHSKCELAYFVGEGYEGKGITHKAVKQAIDLAFNELGLHKVLCKIDVANIASCRVAEKAGLEREGTLRQEYRLDDGSFVDIAYYGIINK